MLERRLQGFGHVQRTDGGERTLRVDVVKEDMRVFGVSEGDAEDRIRWGRIICCGDP